jgi:hypothetical protein
MLNIIELTEKLVKLVGIPVTECVTEDESSPDHLTYESIETGPDEVWEYVVGEDTNREQWVVDLNVEIPHPELLEMMTKELGTPKEKKSVNQCDEWDVGNVWVLLSGGETECRISLIEDYIKTSQPRT